MRFAVIILLLLAGCVAFGRFGNAWNGITGPTTRDVVEGRAIEAGVTVGKAAIALAVPHGDLLVSIIGLVLMMVPRPRSN